MTAAVFALFKLCSGNFSGLDASCADVDPSGRSVLFHSYSLYVCIPLSSCMTIGVGYVVSGYLTLAADLALLGHLDYLLTANG